MKLFARITEIAHTLADALIGAPAPLKPGDTLVDIIMHETIAFKSATTGGTIAKLDLDEAKAVAADIVKYTPGTSLDVAMIAACAAGESRFDVGALCPNMQTVPKGTIQTAHEIFEHTDIGFGQFSCKNLLALPEFKGLADAQIVAKCEDLSWAIPHMASIIRGLLTSTGSVVAKDPSILDVVPGRSFLVLATEGYNKGALGAELVAEADEKAKTPGAGFSYGVAWVQRYHTYCAVLGITPSPTGFAVPK